MATTAESAQAPLNDLMMAMDVVDTLRHGEALVERELSADQRRARMIERLREIYGAQGIEVSDRVLAEGVEALEQDRFVYKPRRGGFAFTLARLYIHRRTIARVTGIVVGAFIVIGGAWYFLSERAAEQSRIEAAQLQTAAQRLQTELTETIPADLARLGAAIAEVVNDPSVGAQALVVAEDGAEAAAAGNAEQARDAVAALENTLSDLRRSFDVLIESRTGVQSGLFRIPDANSDARNYYLIVEAIGPDGDAIERPITSEETGRTHDVTIWGVRVPKAVYDSVLADFNDDGIIQNNVMGEKIRGDLEVIWRVETLGGSITDF